MSRRGNAGFTLLELVVSLAISALALAGLTHLVQDAAGLDTRLGERLRSAGQSEALFVLLEQLFTDARRELSSEALRLAGNSGRTSISGDGQAITVVSRGPRVLGLIDPTSFTLAFDEGSAWDRSQIVLTWSSTDGTLQREVVANAKAFRIRYGMVSSNGDIAWTDSWSRPVAALALVEASYVEPVSRRRISRLIRVTPSLPRICVLRPLLEGCPEWR